MLESSLSHNKRREIRLVLYATTDTPSFEYNGTILRQENQLLADEWVDVATVDPSRWMETKIQELENTGWVVLSSCRWEVLDERILEGTRGTA